MKVIIMCLLLIVLMGCRPVEVLTKQEQVEKERVEQSQANQDWIEHLLSGWDCVELKNDMCLCIRGKWERGYSFCTECENLPESMLIAQFKSRGKE